MKITQDARQIAELKEFKDKFWITDIYKPYHTSGPSPGIMHGIIGNDEELYYFTWFNRDEFEEALTWFDEIRVLICPISGMIKVKSLMPGINIYIRHAFLMSYIRCILNMPQFVLDKMFRIDKTVVSRYLKFVAIYDDHHWW